MKNRVGIVALLQESNTFIPQPTTLAHFEQDILLRGSVINRFLSEVRGATVQVVPLGDE